MATPSWKELESSRSPDGLYTAEIWESDCQPGSTLTPERQAELRLIGPSGSITLATQRRSCDPTGKGGYGLGNLRWSGDSRFLYYTTSAFAGFGRGACPWFPAAMRYDLHLQVADPISMGLDSPDQMWSAYPLEETIALISWETGVIRTIAKASPGGGVESLVWSGDSRMLAYLENADYYCLPGHPKTVSVWEIDTGDVVSWAVPSGAGDAIRLEWGSEDLLVLMYRDGAISTLAVSDKGLEPVP